MSRNLERLIGVGIVTVAGLTGCTPKPSEAETEKISSPTPVVTPSTKTPERGEPDCTPTPFLDPTSVHNQSPLSTPLPEFQDTLEGWKMTPIYTATNEAVDSDGRCECDIYQSEKICTGGEETGLVTFKGVIPQEPWEKGCRSCNLNVANFSITVPCPTKPAQNNH